MAAGVLVLLCCVGLVTCAVLNGNNYDTIVVGLGSAGTTAASTLAKAGKRVLALEAQDRIGGRVWTVPFGNGVIELGAEWIHGTNGSRVYTTAVNASIPLVYGELTLETYNADGSVADTEIIKDIINYGIDQDTQGNLPEKPMRLGDFVSGKVTQYIKEKYPKKFNDQVFMDQIFRFLNIQLSNLEAANDWNDVTTGSQYEELEGNQITSWATYGYKTFFELLLNKYNNGSGLPNLDIKLNTEVTNINYENNGAVSVTCKDGAIYHAKNVIVTMSLGVLKAKYSTLFTPSLPEDKVTSINNLSFGTVNKFLLRFSKQWWPKDKMTFGFLWSTEDINKINEQDRSWLTNMCSASCPEGASDVLTIWFNGNAAVKMETIDTDEVKTKCMQVLRMFMGRNTTIPDPVEVLRSSWHSNPFTQGSYSYDNSWVAETAAGREARATLSRPLGPLLFAGEATNSVHFSTVHGASETGYREAMRILTGKVPE